MKSRLEPWLVFPFVFVVLAISHLPLLHLPYLWDEAGYYVPAAVDFYRHGLLIPRITPPNGHTPLLMVYLGGVWHLLGFGPVVTRLAMILIAAATVASTYRLGSRVAGREAGAWAALLLALSPTFFAQSSLVYASLPAALFTTLALLFALDRRWGWVAATLSLAVLSKEIAVIAVPLIWLFLFFRVRERRAKIWLLATVPAAILGLWAVYYHHATGFWTGNPQYLQYNLYSSLRPAHMARAVIERTLKVFVLGFNWLVVAAAVAGIRRWRKQRRQAAPREHAHAVSGGDRFSDFAFLAVGLVAVYIVFLSVVGGAVLSRYLVPVFPALYIACVALIRRLPGRTARLVCVVVAVCFVGSWFLNPPYTFPYDDNLSYATFIRLHQRAAGYLQSLPDHPVILTAWPATEELTRPFLGYVSRPQRVARLIDFGPAALAHPPRFDVFYLYSREWHPANGWLDEIPALQATARFLGYRPGVLVSRFHLRLLKQFAAKGQWVRIYEAASERGAPR